MKQLLALALSAFALPAAADLHVYTPTGQLFMTSTSYYEWGRPDEYDLHEFFDIRLPPEQQPVADLEGTLNIVFVTEAGGSGTPLDIFIARARSDAPELVSFADGGEAMIRWDGYGFLIEYTGPILFDEGDTVGSNQAYDESSGVHIGVANVYSSPYPYPVFLPRDDMDWIGSGATIGVAIEKADGVHYGWITLQRVEFDITISPYTEKYRVLRYAYESDPGVPAPVINAPTPDCIADTNLDGMLTPADFTAWIDAFNGPLTTCDQNRDNACTPADFTAWIANFNAGC